MTTRFRFTLGQIFALSLLGLSLLLGLLFWGLLVGSQRSILESSDRLRLETGERLLNQVVGFRDQATDVVDDVQRELQAHLIDIHNRPALEAALYRQVLNHSDISEVTFTHADATGDDGQELTFADAGRWRISVYRSGTGRDPEAILTQHVEARKGDSGDPATHPTFQTLTMLVNLSGPVWSDLQWSELAPGGSASHLRPDVTVQQAILDGKKFLGVVRVGLLQERLDAIVQRSAAATDPALGEKIHHICFLCDAEGRLVTPVTSTDQRMVDNDDIRVASPNMPAPIAAALRMPQLRQVNNDNGPEGGTVTAGGKDYLVTFLPIARTQDWVLAVIGNRNEYLGDLIRTQYELLVGAVVVMATILLCGAMTLRAVQRGLAKVIGVTSRMREFDFVPSGTAAPFRDVQRVLDSLEQAKTAMRAMGKYVPVDLVRDLYHMNREPMLGGQTRDLSIMFTDIKGFTDLSETLTPDRLALALGHYLEAMAAAIQTHEGTIDKYIGDSVMAIWNAPAPCMDHAVKACAAALACQEATKRVNESADWKGLPPLVTRCGIHRDRVMVGHFGAPDRLSYTALGDGVNLASRLEGLSKQYGTTILVSETVERDAAGKFQFRLLDRVAVKGKKQAVKVYELLGVLGDVSIPMDAVRTYEGALAAYWGRQFAQAREMLSGQLWDNPSAALAERCARLLISPPPEDWDGVYISMVK